MSEPGWVSGARSKTLACFLPSPWPTPSPSPSSVSLLIIEHDMPLSTSIWDEIVALDLGRVVTRGTADEVRGDARVIASYLGSTAEVVSRSGARVVDPGADAPPVEEIAATKKKK